MESNFTMSEIFVRSFVCVSVEIAIFLLLLLAVVVVVWVFCLRLCLYTTYMQSPRKPEESMRAPEA